MKTRRTQGAMVWVCGVRKWTLRTTTVTQMLQGKMKALLESSPLRTFAKPN